MIRVAVLGAGWVATARHLPVYRSHKQAEVVGVYDRNPDRARSTAQAFNAPLGTDDLDVLFAARPEVVSICTSPWSHAEFALKAFEEGCHVLTEKPMAMNSAEARRMSDAANDADRLLCVSHNFLFSHAVRKADEKIAGTESPRYVMGLQLSSDERRLPPWHSELPGGLLFDEIPHLLYMLQHYLGRLDLDGVRVATWSDSGLPRITEIGLRGERGPGHVTVASGAPVSEWHITLVTNDGVVDLDLFRDIVIQVGSDRAHKAKDILRTSARAVLGHISGFVASGLRLTTRRMYWGHDVLISRFLDAVVNGRPSPVGIEDALNIVSLTDDILAALDAD